MSLLEVFVGNYPMVDWDLYSLWVTGSSVPEAVEAVRTKGGAGCGGHPLDLLEADTADCYRQFGLWEPLLHSPARLRTQAVYQLDPASQARLVALYYSLDSAVLRELLGRKLSSRLRKDLDETAERTGVSLRSCRRQFDNFKRVLKSVEEQPGNLQQNIRTAFLLPDPLAQTYTVAVFITLHRFEVCKKKLAVVRLEDWVSVCSAIRRDWSGAGLDVDEGGEAYLDRDFCAGLRDLKVLVEREKEFRYAVCQQLGRQNLHQRSLAEIEANFKNINKNIVCLGQSLYNNKELRELFVNIVEKIVEPFKQFKFSAEDLTQFLSCYLAVVRDGTVKLEPELNKNFVRFIQTLNVLIIIFFKACVR